MPFSVLVRTDEQISITNHIAQHWDKNAFFWLYLIVCFFKRSRLCLRLAIDDAEVAPALEKCLCRQYCLIEKQADGTCWVESGENRKSHPQTEITRILGSGHDTLHKNVYFENSMPSEFTVFWHRLIYPNTLVAAILINKPGGGTLVKRKKNDFGNYQKHRTVGYL